MPAAVEPRSGIVDVHAFQSGGEPVGIALTANLAVRDDVQTGTLLSADRQYRRVILRFFEKLRRNAPKLRSARAWRQTSGEFLSINQPFRLRIRTN